MAELYGSRENFLNKIDELFAAEPEYRIGTYGAEINEMTEMASLNFGQCAISNQPSFHIPYIYAALGDMQKSAHLVERLCLECFDNGDSGFPGDEDNGTMAAWYIFSVLGFYPYCPGKAEYVNVGKMLVDKAIICGKEWNPEKYDNKIPYNEF